MKCIITNIQRMSIHDGPGIRSTVFLKECNMRCKWCHNPETWTKDYQIQYIAGKCIHCGDCIFSCPHNSLSISDKGVTIDRQKCISCGSCVMHCTTKAISIVGQSLDTADIHKIILQDKAFYDESGGGVTFSGGEPTMQKEPLIEMLKLCKQSDIHTAIETNLTTDKKTLDLLIPLIDLWICDFKIAESNLHRKWTGIPNETIISNLKYLSGMRIPILVRTPVIPGVNDNEDAIRDICEIIKDIPNIHYELLGFHSLGFNKFEQLGMNNQLDGIHSLSKGLLTHLKAIPLDYNIIPYEKQEYENIR